MGKGRGVGEVVDRDDLEVRDPFARPEKIPPDPSKTVNRYA
jgi:hypothetical protein